MDADVEALCRAYSKRPAGELRADAAELLSRTGDPADAGWLWLLTGCVAYDEGDRAAADAARAEALRCAAAAGDGQIEGWAHELAAWFALVEGRYEQAAAHARAGRAVAGDGDAAVQLALQEAKACARLGDRTGTAAALADAEALLAALPPRRHHDNHFVFDPSKFDFFAAGCHLQLGDDARAEALLLAGIARHVRPDGTTDAPLRTAAAQLDLALVAARRGDLAAALAWVDAAYGHPRLSLAELAARSADLLALLDARGDDGPDAQALRDRLRRLVPRAGGPSGRGTP